MSILKRILLAFCAVLAVGALQGTITALSFSSLVARVDVAIVGPVRSVDAARASWDNFEKAQEFLSDITEGIQFQATENTLPTLTSKIEAIETELERLKDVLASDSAISVHAEAVQSIAQWKSHALILAGEEPATSIPAPHLMAKLESSIRDRLDRLVTQAIADAEHMRTEIASGAATMRWLIWTVLGGSLIFGLGLAASLAVSMTRPMARLEAAMARLSEGWTDIPVPDLKRRDEIGSMARALEVFKANTLAKARLEDEAASQRRKVDEAREQAAEARNKNSELRLKVAEEQADFIHALGDGLARLTRGDLTYRLSVGSSESFDQIKKDFNTTVVKLQQMIDVIAASTASVQSEAAGIASGISNLAQRTEHQGYSLQVTSASMEQLTVTVRQNADNAQEANKLAVTARQSAASGSNISLKAVAAINEVEASSQQIAKIVGLIEEIAFQTNILALNASVEAASAGKAGRGFAVVATEVRALALRTAQSSKDIKQLISSSEVRVKEGAELVKQAGNSLSDIVISIVKLAEFVSEVAVASQEQAAGIDQVSQAISGMDTVTQQNAALVGDTNAALQSTRAQVDELRHAVEFFRTREEWSAPAPHAAAQRAAIATHKPARGQPSLPAGKLTSRTRNAASA